MPESVSFLIDANVLIDYRQSDLTILKLFSQKVGRVYVARTILREVKGLSQAECEKHEFSIVSPSIEQVAQAGLASVSVSFDDYLCYLIAKGNGYILITNDKPLRRLCEADEVRLIWGLELMLLLHRNGYLSQTEAISVAESIHRSNSAHISKSILHEFKRKLQRYH